MSGRPSRSPDSITFEGFTSTLPACAVGCQRLPRQVGDEGEGRQLSDCSRADPGPAELRPLLWRRPVGFLTVFEDGRAPTLCPEVQQRLLSCVLSLWLQLE